MPESIIVGILIEFNLLVMRTRSNDHVVYLVPYLCLCPDLIVLKDSTSHQFCTMFVLDPPYPSLTLKLHYNLD